jgi:hypothetical protein
MVEIEVADTGVGISESYSTTLFERFDQESPPVDEFSNGAGIGLPLLERFSAQMGNCWRRNGERVSDEQFLRRLKRRTKGRDGPVAALAPGDWPHPRPFWPWMDPSTSRVLPQHSSPRWPATWTPDGKSGLGAWGRYGKRAPGRPKIDSSERYPSGPPSRTRRQPPEVLPTQRIGARR